ncbi:hypothetical protein MSG28_011319 [Choristoneura fumiferana]|uniref:Uncharacterized protein n=1 Tax=Choristoneura fumiferana TaxID=7141 RepID=A0ACC0KRV0_CHOFU|nr:hypothetical protein MSG28_011319 [Choristoneura fumiferana]
MCGRSVEEIGNTPRSLDPQKFSRLNIRTTNTTLYETRDRGRANKYLRISEQSLLFIASSATREAGTTADAIHFDELRRDYHPASRHEMLRHATHATSYKRETRVLRHVDTRRRAMPRYVMQTRDVM